MFAGIALVGGYLLIHQQRSEHRPRAGLAGHDHRLGRPVRRRLRLLARRDRRLVRRRHARLPRRRRGAARRLRRDPDARRSTRCCRCASCSTATAAARSSPCSSSAVGMFGVFLFLTYYLQLILRLQRDRHRRRVPADGRHPGDRARPSSSAGARHASQPARPHPRRAGDRRGRHGPADQHLGSTQQLRRRTVLPALLVMGVGMGLVFASAMSVSTHGRARRRRRRGVGGGQHRPAGRRLDRHRAAQHDRGERRDRLRGVARRPVRRRRRRRNAAVHSYVVAFWWAAAIFAAGAALTALVLRSGVAAGRPGSGEHSS